MGRRFRKGGKNRGLEAAIEKGALVNGGALGAAALSLAVRGLLAGEDGRPPSAAESSAGSGSAG